LEELVSSAEADNNALTDPLNEPLARAKAAAKDKRFGEAEGICRDVLSSDARNADAWALWGSIAVRQGRLDQAISLIERALSIRPDDVACLGDLSELYRMAYRSDDALAVASKALRIGPPTALAWVRLAKIQVDRDALDDALQAYLAGLAVDPKNANAHLGIGQILLARGDFRPGWIEYEWRNKLDQAKGMLPTMKAPAWNGMAIPKGRILLIADQGFGDALQFARYIPQVATRCREVVLGCSDNLKPLLARIPGVTSCFHRWQESPGFSAYALLSSLPYYFGTMVDTIPAPIPYITPDKDQCADWHARLEERCGTGSFKIGLFWAGRPSHPNDRRRSMRLAQLAPLVALDGVSLISLAKQVPEIDAPLLADLCANQGVIDLSQDLGTFDDTAAVISNLDLVITVDSAVAHLAGSLGRRVWLMTPRPADWRWLLDRSDSPWYPTMRLFRQPRPGAWAEVVEAIREELTVLLAARGHEDRATAE